MASSDSFPRRTFTEFVPSGNPAFSLGAAAAAAAPVGAQQANSAGDLKKQIEHYFSTQNLSTDFYLNGLMDADNFVPITSIAGFKRMKNLTENLSLIIETMKSIPSLEVVEEHQVVRSRAMPISREIRVEVPQGQMPAPQDVLLPAHVIGNLEQAYLDNMHIVFLFKTEQNATEALAGIRSKAAAEHRRVNALIHDPRAPAPRQKPRAMGPGMYPPYPFPGMYFPAMPYGMPHMFPGAPHFGGPRPRHDRRNRPNHAAGGHRREEPAPFVPRVVSDGMAVAEPPRRDFAPRRLSDSDGLHHGGFPPTHPAGVYGQFPAHMGHWQQPAFVPEPGFVHSQQPPPQHQQTFPSFTPAPLAHPPHNPHVPHVPHMPPPPPTHVPQGAPHVPPPQHHHAHPAQPSQPRTQANGRRQSGEHHRGGEHRGQSGEHHRGQPGEHRNHSGEHRSERRGPRRQDGGQQVTPQPPPEPSPSLGTELFPPLASVNRTNSSTATSSVSPAASVPPATSPAPTPTSAPAAAAAAPVPKKEVEQVAASVANLSVVKTSPPSQEVVRSTASSPERLSFADMLKRKQSEAAAAAKPAGDSTSA